MPSISEIFGVAPEPQRQVTTGMILRLLAELLDTEDQERERKERGEVRTTLDVPEMPVRPRIEPLGGA